MPCRFPNTIDLYIPQNLSPFCRIYGNTAKHLAAPCRYATNSAMRQNSVVPCRLAHTMGLYTSKKCRILLFCRFSGHTAKLCRALPICCIIDNAAELYHDVPTCRYHNPKDSANIVAVLSFCPIYNHTAKH